MFLLIVRYYAVSLALFELSYLIFTILIVGVFFDVDYLCDYFLGLLHFYCD